MRILVYGAGALGSVIGGFLAKSSNQVTFLGREAHIRQIREAGLQISGIWGEHLVCNVRGITSLAEDEPCEYDLVLVTVKSYDTQAVALDLKANLRGSPYVISLQNGYGNYEKLARVLGSDQVLAGRVIIGFRLNSPGCAEVTVFADKIAIGAPDERIGAEKVEDLVELFNQADLPAFYTDNIGAYIWAKIIYNCALNPLSAITRVPYGALGENKETRALMDLVIEEIYLVARKAGIKLLWDELEGIKKAFYEQMLPPTASHNSSMLQDLNHGKRLEIDALNGAVVELGNRYEVAVPVNETLVRLIKFLETRNQSA